MGSRQGSALDHRSISAPSRAQRKQGATTVKILQALPALYSGGVERGTVEFAAELVKRGHQSFVVSNGGPMAEQRSEEHTSELQSRPHLVCRLLLEKKNGCRTGPSR